MTKTETKKTESIRAVPPSIAIDISNAMTEIMLTIEDIACKDPRSPQDEINLHRLIKAARLLPIYRHDLQKYF